MVRQIMTYDTDNYRQFKNGVRKTLLMSGMIFAEGRNVMLLTFKFSEMPVTKFFLHLKVLRYFHCNFCTCVYLSVTSQEFCQNSLTDQAGFGHIGFL